MSLDIEVKYKEQKIEINWLRNPFGLCSWVEDNVESRYSLYKVCNKWTYGKSKKVNRKYFLKVVNDYLNKIQGLRAGYFAFDLGAYIQFVEKHSYLFPKEQIVTDYYKIIGSFYRNDKLYIPMEYFNKPEYNLISNCYPGGMLTYYKNWYNKLYDIALLLQNKKSEFYCSN